MMTAGLYYHDHIMSNPFVTKWRFTCYGCGAKLPKGVKAFYHVVYKYCRCCAARRYLVCLCEAYKKPESVICDSCDVATKEGVSDDFS